jgi:hypothetical protein
MCTSKFRTSAPRAAEKKLKQHPVLPVIVILFMPDVNFQNMSATLKKPYQRSQPKSGKGVSMVSAWNLTVRPFSVLIIAFNSINSIIMMNSLNEEDGRR